MQRKLRCLDAEDDFYVIVSGTEGSGKSMLALAMAYNMDPRFSLDNVFYRWEDYVKLNIQAIAASLDGVSQEQLNTYGEKFGLDFSSLNADKKSDVDVGSSLLYDEAILGLHSRGSMGKSNVVLGQLAATNRHLRLCHVVCIPKPRNLDQYFREERLKHFLWVENLAQIDQPPQRQILWYSHKAFNKLMSTDSWRKLFSYGAATLKRVAPPTAIVNIPDLTRPKYGSEGGAFWIDPKVIEEYKLRKRLFHFAWASGVIAKTEEKVETAKPDNSDLWVKTNPDGSVETKEQWVLRTNRYPTEYSNFGGPKKVKGKRGRPRKVKNPEKIVDHPSTTKNELDTVQIEVSA